MAWDENVCAESPAPEFDIPEDKSAKEILLEILGYEEITISKTDANGDIVTAYVLGRVEEG